MRTSFLHLADTRLGFRDPADPDVFQKVAQQFRFAMEFAVDQRATFVLFSGQLFAGADVEPDALQVALRGLNQLAAKNITAIAVRGPSELRRQPGNGMSWHDLLAQEGLLASLEANAAENNQLALSRWERREGRGSFVDLGRARVFGLHYAGSMAQVLLPSLAKAIGAQDNREADFKIVLLPGLLENFSAAFGARLAYSDLLLLRRNVDYIALGGCDDAYESEGWVYNPGCHGFYHVTVDTAVQPKHTARHVSFPEGMHVARPAPPVQRITRREQEERIFDELVLSSASRPGDEAHSQLERDVVRLLTQTMWDTAPSSDLRARLLEAAAEERDPSHAA